MAVLMKRSTKMAWVSWSTSYLTGSAFIGISMITLKASGQFLPGVTLSRDIRDSWVALNQENPGLEVEFYGSTPDHCQKLFFSARYYPYGLLSATLAGYRR